MVHSFKNATPDSNWAWYDIETPTPEELNKIAADFNLHPAAVQDCLQPDHLPKFEEMGELSVQFGSMDELNGLIDRLRGKE
jgi:magnesium transporter